MGQQGTSTRTLEVNPQVFSKIKKLGAFDVSACFNCGNCTVSCPLSVSGNEFPRKHIRYALLGLNDKLLAQPEPWLCYYCGDCSDTCPSKADPGAFMAAARRHAIVEYSIFKIGRVFYSPLTAIFAYLVLTIFAIWGIWFFTPEGGWNLDEWDVFSVVTYNVIHIAGLVLAGFIFTIAFIHALTMLYHLSKGNQISSEIPLYQKLVAMIKSVLKVGISEGIAEYRFTKCNSKSRYIAHMNIFWGYVLTFAATSIIAVPDMFTTTILGWSHHKFDDELYSIVKPIAKVLGVVGGILLMLGCAFYILGRLINKETYFQTTLFSDWIFLLITFGIGLSGFLIDIFEFFDMLELAYWMYSVHLILIFHLIITAAFTKFAHMEYRLIAVWYAEYQNLLGLSVSYKRKS
ncbi:MAG: 4Fe-4S dicluster domain-containing protein [Promethearchaeota archaeon]